MHPRLAVSCLAGVLLLVAVPCSRGEANPADPLDRILDAYGGAAALSPRPRLVRTGEFVEPTGERRRLSVTTTGAETLVRTVPPSDSSWIVRGGFGYRADGDGRFEPITDVSLGILVLQGTVASLPWILLDHRSPAGVLPSDARTGAPGPIVMALNPRLTMTVTIDPRTSRAAAVALGPTEGGPGTMTALLDDFRPQAGTFVPFLETYAVDGQPVGRFITSAVSAGGEADVAP